MVEDAASKNSVEININSSKYTSLTINRVYGLPVADPLNFKQVQALQETLNEDPHIYENFGPALNTVTDKTGKKRNVPENKSKHLDHIYVSVRPPSVMPANSWKTVTADEGGKDCPPDNGKTYELRADFDGNGRPDVARLQINPRTRHRRLAVWLNGAEKPQILVDDSEDFAGSFMTLVSKGTKQVSIEDGQTAVTLKTPGIGYGGCQSSESVYYCDAKSKTFKNIWISD